MYSLEILARARDDIVDIWLYSYEHWGEDQADTYTLNLDQALHKLAQNPLHCRERIEFSPPVRIYHFQKHLAIYQVKNTVVTIVRILHEKMDLDFQLSNAEL